MKRKPIVLHLVDDTTAGGVMRVVDFIDSAAQLSQDVTHIQMQVSRGTVAGTRYAADLIVSHMTLNWRMIPGLLALRAANSGTPMVHVEHSYTEGFVAHNVRHRRRFAALLRLGFSMFDRVVAVSHAQAKWVLTRGYCTSKKLTTIQSCVDLSQFRALPAPKGPIRIFGAIGRLEPQKGFETLITAFKHCPGQDIALYIYGQGKEETRLRALAAGDVRISFKGFASDPIEAVAQVDMVIVPSRWEAYGLVAIEALSAGRPVLCTNVDGLSDHAILGAQTYQEGWIDGLTDRLSALRNTVIAQEPASCRTSNVLEATFITKWRDLIAELTKR